MKVLVADDNLFYCRSLSAMLRQWGYEVVTASDGLGALEVLQGEDAPKLALLDWMMPGIDGLEVCKAIRAQAHPEPPYLLILTAHTGKDDVVTALEAGADDFLPKPFTPAELKARIRVGARTVGLQRSQTMVFVFARSVEAKSPYTRGHSERVKDLCLQMADHLDLSGRERETLRSGALLHDIGKICMPDAILNKAGPLTDSEFEIVKEHPVQGVRIVEPMDALADVIPLIRWHHERLDGSGYPDRLTGEQIPPLVRLLAVADCFDALTTARPYRAALPLDQTFDILQRDVSEGKLDPEFVDCCREISLPRPTSDAAAVLDETLAVAH